MTNRFELPALPPLPEVGGAQGGAEILEKLGESARQARLSRQWTQEDLAKKAGISFTALKNLEAGKPVALATLLGVLRALGCEANLLQVFTLSSPSLGEWVAVDRQETAPRQRAPKRPRM